MAVHDNEERPTPIRRWGMPAPPEMPQGAPYHNVMAPHLRHPATPQVPPATPPSDILEDDDGMVIVKIPRAILATLVKETLMSNNTNANTAPKAAAAPVVEAAPVAAAPAAAPAAAAAAPAPAAAAPANGGSVTVSVSASPKSKTWLKAVGLSVVSVAAGVGGTLLAQHFGLGSSK